MEKVDEIIAAYRKLKKRVAELSSGNATLVLASKTVPKEVLCDVAQSEVVIYGENRVQELTQKYFVSPNVIWHFIGRLQTNKVKYIVDKVAMIQSVDSLRLAEEIEKRCAKINKVMDILLEVNMGEEAAKGGVLQGELPQILCAIKEMPHLRVCGLMSVLPNAAPEIIKPLYEKLYMLYNEVKAIKADSFCVKYLSAGMSGDYELALSCGSNMVRLGSAVFGARQYPAK